MPPEPHRIAALARAGHLSAFLDSGHAHANAAVLTRLREQLGAEAAAWLMTCAAVQTKAREKLGPGVWWATERAVQQASDRVTARYKAQRFPAGACIYDVCCGLGGDALALGQRGAVVAVDCDPVVAAMAAANLQMQGGDTTLAATAVLCTRAEQLTLTAAESFLHIDPDRRGDQRRTVQPEHYQPGLPSVQRLIDQARGAAVKLAPAARLPEASRGRCQREWISYRGSVRQQVAWFGQLSGPDGSSQRMATRLGVDAEAHSFAASEWDRPAETAEQCGAFIIDIDAAVRAAGLSDAFAHARQLRVMGDASGFFTADTLPADPLASVYEVLWSGAADLKHIKRAAAGLRVRLEEIKVRGTEHRPEILRKQLTNKKTQGQATATLLLGRTGSAAYAVIARRIVSTTHRVVRNN